MDICDKSIELWPVTHLRSACLPASVFHNCTELIRHYANLHHRGVDAHPVIWDDPNLDVTAWDLLIFRNTLGLF